MPTIYVSGFPEDSYQRVASYVVEHAGGEMPHILKKIKKGMLTLIFVNQVDADQVAEGLRGMGCKITLPKRR